MTRRRLWPFFFWTDHNLDGYGGTWSRAYTFGIRTRSHNFGIQFRSARYREIGK